MSYKKYLEEIKAAQKGLAKAKRILRIAEKRFYRKARPDPKKLRKATLEDLKIGAVLWIEDRYSHKDRYEYTPVIVRWCDSKGSFTDDRTRNYEVKYRDVLISTE